MRALTRLIALLLPLAVAAQQPTPKAAPVSNVRMTALEQTLSAVLQSAHDAWQRHDIARVTASWPDGTVLVNEAGPRTLRTADILKLMQRCTMQSYSIEGLKARQLAPDVALATFTLNVDQSCDGTLEPPHHFVTALFERHAGRWTITHQHITAAKP